MTSDKTNPDATDPNGSEEEDAGSGPKLDMGDELEAALAEASEAIDARHAQRGARKGGDATPDKIMLEALSAELQTVKADYEAASAELADLKDAHLRLQAEFDNFRRRSMKEREETFQYGHQELVKELLTTVDNLERAIQHAKDGEGADPQALLDGVELVQRELLGVFGKHGVTRIEALGKPFDPNVHEAMGQIEDGSVPPNTVVQVLQTGYQLRDRMLRPALVMVSKAAAFGQKGEKPGGRSADEAPEDESHRA